MAYGPLPLRRTVSGLLYAFQVQKRYFVKEFSKTLEPQFEKKRLKEICNEIKRSKDFRQSAMDYGLEDKVYRRVLKSFCSQLASPSQFNIDTPLTDVLSAIHDKYADIDSLFPFFVEHTKEKYPLESVMKTLKSIADLSEPRTWYPYAQEVDRKFILHLGPTNSGKTHSALQEFHSASNGVYCSPLRMLAAEIFRKTNDMGVLCDLHTGEERQYGSGSEDNPAHHVACTVEMAHITPLSPYDVAVIDEIQMIADKRRGGAWTRALLGIPAKTIHVCGEATVLLLLKKLIKSVGGEVEIRDYQRLKPLVPLNNSLKGLYSKVRAGDCVVTFARQKIFKLKQEIETFTRQSCAVVYGGLPPATRNDQATLFNDSKHKILVASDAVGMGLNLNIKRIVFHNLTKFDGKKIRYLTPSEVRQISGRAGRYGKDHSRGEVTTFYSRDLPMLHRLINSPFRNIEKAGLSPSFEQIKSFSYYLPDHSLPELLSIFLNTATVSRDFFLCRESIEQQINLANMLVEYDFHLRDSFTLSLAPVDDKSTSLIAAYKLFVESLSINTCVTLSDLHRIINWPLPPPKGINQMVALEEAHEIVNLYLWLSQRFSDLCPDNEGAGELQDKLEDMIGRSLKRRSRTRSRVRIDKLK